MLHPNHTIGPDIGPYSVEGGEGGGGAAGGGGAVEAAFLISSVGTIAATDDMNTLRKKAIAVKSRSRDQSAN